LTPDSYSASKNTSETHNRTFMSDRSELRD